MCDDSTPYEYVPTFLDHTTETSLRAALAASHATRIMVQICLATQRPAHPTLEKHRLVEADRLLAEARKWTRLAIDGPDASG